MNNKVINIGIGKIYEVEKVLKNYGISGKILYIAGSHVDSLYGGIVRQQIEAIGKIKEQKVEHNTITYAMEVAERVIATDIDCIVAMGGGKTLDVAKYAAYVSKRPFLSTVLSILFFFCIVNSFLNIFLFFVKIIYSNLIERNDYLWIETI